jgi:hypothetical protein
VVGSPNRVVLAVDLANGRFGLDGQFWLETSHCHFNQTVAAVAAAIERMKKMGSPSYVKQAAVPVVREADRIVELGEQQGWPFAVLGYAPMPTQPVYIDEWLLVPAMQDSSPIPERAWQRIQAIYAAGIRPQGFVVVHEAPKLLAASQTAPIGKIRLSRISEGVKTGLRVAGLVLLGLAAISGLISGLLALAAVIVSLAGVLLVIPLLLVVTFLGLDPILVCVTDNGEWIAIDSWIV